MMGGLGFTGRLARGAARRPWVTLGLWVLLIAAGMFAASGLGDVLTQEGRCWSRRNPSGRRI